MEPFEFQQVKTRVLERLENGDDPNDIILQLCEQANLNWPDAEALVKTIESENKTHIVLAQSPMLTLLSIGIFLGGAAMLGIAVYDISTVVASLIESKDTAWGLTGIILYFIQYGEKFLLLGLLGTGMIIGSMRGMQDVWTAIFDKLGFFQN